MRAPALPVHRGPSACWPTTRALRGPPRCLTARCCGRPSPRCRAWRPRCAGGRVPTTFRRALPSVLDLPPQLRGEARRLSRVALDDVVVELLQRTHVRDPLLTPCPPLPQERGNA